MKFSKKEAFGLALGGLASGFANGMLGAGGGIIIVYLLNSLLKTQIKDSRDIFANALCVMLPISVVSSLIYAFRGNIDTAGFALFTVPAILGGIIGGFILGRINAGSLKKLFAYLVVWSGIMLMIK